MEKKNSLLKVIICVVSLGVFLFFEHDLLKRYVNEKRMRKYIKERNTTELIDSFLLRRKDFYLDKEYLKKFENLNKESSIKGEE